MRAPPFSFGIIRKSPERLRLASPIAVDKFAYLCANFGISLETALLVAKLHYDVIVPESRKEIQATRRCGNYYYDYAEFAKEGSR
jgi:hypothetical protein